MPIKFHENSLISLDTREISENFKFFHVLGRTDTLIIFQKSPSSSARFCSLLFTLIETVPKIDPLRIFWIARPGGLRVDFREPVLSALLHGKVIGQSYVPLARICAFRVPRRRFWYTNTFVDGGFETGTDTLLQNGLGNIY